MAPERETIMVLKVDLDCYRCYRRVKCVLCRYPHIQDQVYNTKQNTVTIKVVCCSPEKIRDKILRKGGKSIKGIEIVEPKKPADKQPSKPASAPAPPADKPAPAPEKPKAEKPKDAPPPADAKPPEKKKNGSKNGSSKPDDPPAKPKDPEQAPKPAAETKPAAPVPQADPILYHPGYPINVVCSECYEGGGYGPCYHGYGSRFGSGYGYGVPPPPAPAAGGWGYFGGGSPGGYGYSYNSKPGYCVSRRGDYVTDENPTLCVIM